MYLNTYCIYNVYWQRGIVYFIQINECTLGCMTRQKEPDLTVNRCRDECVRLHSDCKDLTHWSLLSFFLHIQVSECERDADTEAECGSICVSTIIVSLQWSMHAYVCSLCWWMYQATFMLVRWLNFHKLIKKSTILKTNFLKYTSPYWIYSL